MVDRRAWSDDEDRAIRELVDTFGIKKWTIVAQKMEELYKLNGRSGKQCRERWHNHLDPHINKQPWTEQEEKIIFENHKKCGNKWAEIARHLPGSQLYKKKREEKLKDKEKKILTKRSGPSAKGKRDDQSDDDLFDQDDEDESQIEEEIEVENSNNSNTNKNAATTNGRNGGNKQYLKGGSKEKSSSSNNNNNNINNNGNNNNNKKEQDQLDEVLKTKIRNGDKNIFKVVHKKNNKQNPMNRPIIPSLYTINPAQTLNFLPEFMMDPPNLSTLLDPAFLAQQQYLLNLYPQNDIENFQNFFGDENQEYNDHSFQYDNFQGRKKSPFTPNGSGIPKKEFDNDQNDNHINYSLPQSRRYDYAPLDPNFGLPTIFGNNNSSNNNQLLFGQNESPKVYNIQSPGSSFRYLFGTNPFSQTPQYSMKLLSNGGFTPRNKIIQGAGKNSHLFDDNQNCPFSNQNLKSLKNSNSNESQDNHLSSQSLQNNSNSKVQRSNFGQITKDEQYLTKIANEVKNEIQANDQKFKKKQNQIIQLNNNLQNGGSAANSQNNSTMKCNASNSKPNDPSGNGSTTNSTNNNNQNNNPNNGNNNNNNDEMCLDIDLIEETYNDASKMYIEMSSNRHNKQLLLSPHSPFVINKQRQKYQAHQHPLQQQLNGVFSSQNLNGSTNQTSSNNSISNQNFAQTFNNGMMPMMGNIVGRNSSSNSNNNSGKNTDNPSNNLSTYPNNSYLQILS